MKLSEVFSQLSYGELSNLSMAGPDGDIPPEKYERIVNHINTGLTALYTRFTLQVGTLDVDLIEGQVQYVLKRLFQVGNAAGKRNPQYIRASNPVFQEDIALIEQVFDQTGRELALNDGNNQWSVMCPNMNTIRVPLDLVREKKITSVRVQYRAMHRRILWEDKSFDPEDEEIDLPYTHLQALLYFVASRIHNPIGFSETVHEGNNYAAKFERECANLMAQNLRVDTDDMNIKPMRGGWV